MILLKKSDELKKYLISNSTPDRKIGLVPTMGALHKGHLSLIALSKGLTAITVCSIFVNPTQFNDPADFEKYPVTLEQDLYLLEKAGCDVVFVPSVSEMYPGGKPQNQPYPLGRLETLLEGKYRPGHFQGVCQVVHRLLDIVMPGDLFLGQKDYQQCMVIAELIRQTGLKTKMVIGPTLREPSGLAMSSRNMRLSDADKIKATAIYHALGYIGSHLKKGPVSDLLTTAGSMLTRAGFEKTDYISIADAQTLEPVTDWDGHSKLVALAAAFLSGVRLIDNMVYR